MLRVCIIILASCVLFLPGQAAAYIHAVTSDQAAEAFAYAKSYVDNEVAFLMGGHSTVEEYLVGLQQGKLPGQDIGVDASALVRNSYRAVIPAMRFRVSADGPIYRHVNSSALFHWNSHALDEDAVEQGDLLFFQNASGQITGVGMFSHSDAYLVHFVIASANAGKAILTALNPQGTYWQQAFAGYGRLTYVLPE